MRSWSTRRWRKGSPGFSARCPPGPDAVCGYLLTPYPNPVRGVFVTQQFRRRPSRTRGKIHIFTFNLPKVMEIAPDVFRFCLYAPEINLQFNFFLIRDDEPLLFTTGYRSSFRMLREAVARVID